MLTELVPEFEKILQIILRYLVLDIFRKTSFALGSYFILHQPI